MTRICAFCGDEFTGRAGQRYCSAGHRRSASDRRNGKPCDLCGGPTTRGARRCAGCCTGTVTERFWPKVERVEDGCWLWTASLTGDGYGRISLGGKFGPMGLAHRVAYELLVGPIPEGLELDHLCRVRRCVNPEHLEPVTHAENVRRAQEAA